MQLRPYQENALRQVRHAYAHGKRSVLVVSPTGSGKGVILSQLIRQANDKGSKVLFLVHRREILFQVSRYLDNQLIPHGVILAGEDYDYGNNVELATVQTISRRMKRIDYQPADVIVIDECFPAGTMVDGKPIEKITVGDFVSSVNHETGHVESRRVIRTFKNEPASLATVRFSDGTKLTCTEGHPFYVAGEGYVSANQLTGGDYVCKMRMVREGIRDNNEEQKGSIEKNRQSLLILFALVLS